MDVSNTFIVLHDTSYISLCGLLAYPINYQYNGRKNKIGERRKLKSNTVISRIGCCLCAHPSDAALQDFRTIHDQHYAAMIEPSNDATSIVGNRAAYSLNAGYATSSCLGRLSSHMCGLSSHLSGLLFHVYTGSLLNPNTFRWGTKKISGPPSTCWSEPAMHKQAFKFSVS